MESLDNLALKYGTDKSSTYHDYCKTYELYLEPLRNNKISLVEIGVGGYHYADRGGESLRMWYDYFVQGKIIGIDLYDKINIVNDRTEFWQGSQADENLFASILEREKGSDKRIIIDDASHNNSLTIKTFEMIFPLLQSGDIYFIEDVHTSYFEDTEYEGSKDLSANTSMHYFQQLTHQLNYEHLKTEDVVNNKFEFIHFYKELIIVKKK